MNVYGAWPVMHQFARFAASGAVGTAVHYTILIALVSVAECDPVVGSIVGFFAGAVVNYGFSYRFVFRSTSSHQATLWRFFTVALVGVLVNAVLMHVMVHALALHYIFAQVVSTGVVLLSNFVLNRVWTFGRRAE